MANRTTSREDASHGADLAGAGQGALADFTRQQLASSANTTSAVLRALDVFQQAQQQMLQRAALAHSQTAERLRSATNASEVMSAQSTLLVTSMTEATQYGMQLFMAALKAQNELMQRPDDGLSAEANPAAPLFQAWQSAFAATMNNANANANANAASRHH